MDGLPAFLLAAVALAGSPGPATLSLTATGAAFGARRGAAYLAGIVIGMVAVMAIVASGLVGLLLAVPGATPVVTVLAAAYFLYLAWRIATAPPLAADTAERRTPTFAGGLLLSLINPKGYAAMAALFSGFVLVQERLALDVAAKMARARRSSSRPSTSPGCWPAPPSRASSAIRAPIGRSTWRLPCCWWRRWRSPWRSDA